MSTDGIVMKRRLFCDPYSAVELWEFRRELTLTKRLIKTAEKCVEKRKTRDINSFEGVCFYIARSIVNYSKAAFDSMVLGHFDTTEMITRTMLENRVILELIFKHNEYSLWKYYLIHSHYKSLGLPDDTDKCADFDEVCKELDIAADFLESRGKAKPYIQYPYGWTYKVKEIRAENRFKFKGLCDAVGGQQSVYKEFQWMSKAVHGTSFFEKVMENNHVGRIMSLFTGIYINLYLLIVMYCDGIWENDFDVLTDELEAIFYHFYDVHASN